MEIAANYIAAVCLAGVTGAFYVAYSDPGFFVKAIRPAVLAVAVATIAAAIYAIGVMTPLPAMMDSIPPEHAQVVSDIAARHLPPLWLAGVAVATAFALLVAGLLAHKRLEHEGGQREASADTDEK